MLGGRGMGTMGLNIVGLLGLVPTCSMVLEYLPTRLGHLYGKCLFQHHGAHGVVRVIHREYPVISNQIEFNSV